MRAVVQTGIGAPDVLAWREVPDPPMILGGVLIRTTAVGVNFHDVEIRRQGERGLSLPFTPGTDLAGVVERVADDVAHIVPGDRVLALLPHGGYATKVVSHANLTVPIPDGVSDEMAASVPVAGLTAWFLTRDLALPEGSQVVVHAAAGGVGSWFGALLRDTPLRTIGLVSSPAKREVAFESGYDAVVDRSAHPDLVAAVLTATRRRGADLVFDAVAGPAFADSFRMLRPEGTVILYGRAAGPPALADLPEAFLDARKNIGLRTFFLSRTLLARMKEVPDAMSALLEVIRDGGVPMRITTMPLHAAAEAQRLLESGATVGKVVLVPGSGP
jgi:NADPH2:quinone reductase